MQFFHLLQKFINFFIHILLFTLMIKFEYLDIKMNILVKLYILSNILGSLHITDGFSYEPIRLYY